MSNHLIRYVMDVSPAGASTLSITIPSLDDVEGVTAEHSRDVMFDATDDALTAMAGATLAVIKVMGCLLDSGDLVPISVFPDPTQHRTPT